MRISSWLTQPTTLPILRAVMKIWKGSENVSRDWRLLWCQIIILDQSQVYPLAPYPEQQLSQLALEQNSSDYLTTLARLEVHSILRTLEQPGMYVDRSTASNQSSPVIPARSGSQQGTPSRQTAAFALIDLKEGYHSVQANEGPATGPKEHNPSLAFHPIGRPSPSVWVSSSPQVTIHKAWHYWESKVNKEWPYTGLLPCTLWTQQWQPLQVQWQPRVFNPLTLQLVLHPLHRLGQMFLSPLLWTQLHPLPQWEWCMFHKTQVWVVQSIHKVHHNLRIRSSDPYRKCGKKNHTMDKCKKKASHKKWQK